MTMFLDEMQNYGPSSFIDLSDEIKDLKHWLVCNGRKVPVHKGQPVDWVLHNQTFAAAFELAQQNGLYVGLALYDGDGLVGIDFDSCRDPASGVFDSWVQPWLDELAGYGYFDISPSGTGVKVIVRGRWPANAANTCILNEKQGGKIRTVDGKQKRAAIEVYQGRRFFALTGESLPGYSYPDIRDAQSVLDRMMLAYSFEKAADRQETVVEIDQTKPGDHYNTSAEGLQDAITNLEKHGWQVGSPDGDGVMPVTRPGKDTGRSGSLGIRSASGRQLLHVFTSAAEPFEQGQSYTLHRVLALLEFGGSDSRAAGYLVEKGFGKPKEPDAEEPEVPQVEGENEFSVPAIKLFNDLLEKVYNLDGDVLFTVPTYMQGFEVGPGLLTVLGAPPGAGKTALMMSTMFDIMANESELRTLVANCEMSWSQLCRREMARKIENMTAAELRFCNFRDPGAALRSVRKYAAAVVPVMTRIDVMKPTFEISRLQKIPLFHPKPGLLIVDYLQRFYHGEDTVHGIGQVMDCLRNLASLGWAVVAISATARDQKQGHRHKLSLSSFRGSGEIEFAADSCYVLQYDEAASEEGSTEEGCDDFEAGPSRPREGMLLDEHEERKRKARRMILRCEKNRNGELFETPLYFDGANMEFFGDVIAPKPDADLAAFNLGGDENLSPRLLEF
jgi:replicative DNA helicase